MKLKIDINCDNAAFDPPEQEVARILRELADKAEQNNLDSLDGLPVSDVNGNKVGSVFLIRGFADIS